MLQYQCSEWRRNEEGHLVTDVLCSTCRRMVASDMVGLREELILERPEVNLLLGVGHDNTVLCELCRKRTIYTHFADKLAEDWFGKVIKPLGYNWDGLFFADERRNYTGVYGIRYEITAIWMGWNFTPHYRSFWRLLERLGVEQFTGKTPPHSRYMIEPVTSYINSLKPSPEEMEKCYARTAG